MLKCRTIYLLTYKRGARSEQLIFLIAKAVMISLGDGRTNSQKPFPTINNRILASKWYFSQETYLLSVNLLVAEAVLPQKCFPFSSFLEIISSF